MIRIDFDARAWRRNPSCREDGRPAGKVTLWANDKQIGEGRLDQTISLIFTTYAGMDIGRDNGGVVDLAYEDKAPYAFTGTVKQVVFDLKPASHEDLTQLHAHHATQGVGQGVAG